jgi:hypothetical protein
MGFMQLRLRQTVPLLAVAACSALSLSCSRETTQPTPIAEKKGPAIAETETRVTASSLPESTGGRYRWSGDQSSSVGGADGILVMEKPRGSLRIGAIKGGKGLIPFSGERAIIDQPGSRDVHIEIDKSVGRTHYAGLSFTVPCIVEILEDGTLLADQTGLAVRDAKGKPWLSRKVNAGNKSVFVFLPAGSGSETLAQPH